MLNSRVFSMLSWPTAGKVTAVVTLLVLTLSPTTDSLAQSDPQTDRQINPDSTRPVQVFILLGQSNMVGAGKVGPVDKDGTLEHAVREKKLYPYLVDDAGNWAIRDDVRHVRVMGSGLGAMRKFNNEWLTVSGKSARLTTC